MRGGLRRAGKTTSKSCCFNVFRQGEKRKKENVLVDNSLFSSCLVRCKTEHKHTNTSTSTQVTLESLSFLLVLVFLFEVVLFDVCFLLCSGILYVQFLVFFPDICGQFKYFLFDFEAFVLKSTVNLPVKGSIFFFLSIVSHLCPVLRPTCTCV